MAGHVTFPRMTEAAGRLQGLVGTRVQKVSVVSPSHLSPCLASPHSSVPQCSQKVGLL